MAMSYGNVYVAHGGHRRQGRARPSRPSMEAEAYPGPSLIIAYSHCIAHGYDIGNGLEQQKLAVESGILAALPLRPAAHRQGRAAAHARFAAAQGAGRATTWRTRRASAWCEQQNPHATSSCWQKPREKSPQRYGDLRAAREAGRPP